MLIHSIGSMKFVAAFKPTGHGMETSICLVFIICYSIINNVVGQNCDFDNNTICNWLQSNQDDGNWSVTNVEKSAKTGPHTGHTSKINNYYCYLDADQFKDKVNQVIPNTAVVLISPELTGSGTACFRFFYYMYGADVNILSVGVVRVKNSPNIDDTSRRQLFNRTGKQGKEWFCGRISFNFSNSERIYIEAKTGVTYLSNIAIDDLSFEKEADCAKALPCDSTQLPTTDNTITSVTDSNNTQTDFGFQTIIPITTPDPEGGDINANILLYLISIPVALFVTLSVIALVCYCKKSKSKPFYFNDGGIPQTFDNPQYEEAEVYDEIADYDEPQEVDSNVDYNEPYDHYIRPVDPGSDSGPYNTMGARRESNGSVGYRSFVPNESLYNRTGYNPGRFYSGGDSMETDYMGLRGPYGIPKEQAPGRPNLPPRTSQSFDQTSTPPTRCIGPQSEDDYIHPM